MDGDFTSPLERNAPHRGFRQVRQFSFGAFSCSGRTLRPFLHVLTPGSKVSVTRGGDRPAAGTSAASCEHPGSGAEKSLAGCCHAVSYLKAGFWQPGLWRGRGGPGFSFEAGKIVIILCAAPQQRQKHIDAGRQKTPFTLKCFAGEGQKQRLFGTTLPGLFFSVFFKLYCTR